METNVAKHHRLTGKGARSLRRKLLPVLIAGCFGSALANPLGPQVVNGQASFSQQGNTLSVTNTPGAVINWQAFSIGSGEVTRFIQQSASSSVLNRVVGQDPSQILGALQSNGRVFLINPNGILFGAGAQINVNGLIASTLDISNEDFLNGKMRFKTAGTVGNLKNEGTITTPDGGHVYLIAPNVENTGIITSPKGEVLLAAGHSVELVDSANPDLHVVLSAAGNEALNVGEIVTQGGRAGIFGDLVRHSGIVNANSAVVGENGKIMFKASGDTLLENGSRTTATGAGTGGEIQLLGERVGLTGDAIVDASGQQGGGTILIGGDYQGANPDIQNAKYTYSGRAVTIKADAIETGNGGKVILWADDTTKVYSTISAKGGAHSGDGGFVETSGKVNLDFDAKVDTRAANGNTGTVLLDPTTLNIVNGAGAVNDTDVSGDGTINFADSPGTGFSVSELALEGLATNTNVVLEASGTITLEDLADNALTFAQGTGNSVTMHSSTGSIIGMDVNDRILTNGASVNLNANSGNINIGGVRSAGGDVNMTAGGSIVVREILTTPSATGAGGNINLASSTFLTLGGGDIDARGNGGASGNVTLQSGGAISMQTAKTIYANQLKMFAGAGIYGSGPMDFMSTQVNFLNARNTGSGNIRISNSVTDLTINDPDSSGYGIRQDSSLAGVNIQSAPGTSIGIAAPILTNGGAVTVTGGAGITVSDSAPQEISTAGGSINLSATDNEAKITMAAGSSISSGGGSIALQSDKMSLLGAVDATSAGTVKLAGSSSNEAIDVGTTNTDDTGFNRLQLNNAELNTIRAGTLFIGDAMSGDLQIQSALLGGIGGALEKITTALSLRSAGAISQQTGATIDGGSAVSARGSSVTLTEANSTGVVAGSASTGNFSYRTSNKLTVSSVAGTSGISASGDVFLASTHSLGIDQQFGASIVGNRLALDSLGTVELQDVNNNVTEIAANVGAPGAFGYFNKGALSVGGPIAGINGITTASGDVRIVLENGYQLSISSPIQAGAHEVELRADSLALNNTITAGSASIRPADPGRAMTIGAACLNGDPCLSVTNLHRIIAPTIGLGGTSYAGPIYVAGISAPGVLPSSRNAITTRIGLLSMNGVTQGGAIDVQDLGVEANGNVDLSQANQVLNIAARTNGGNFTFHNATGFSVSNISGDNYSLPGIVTAGGAVTLNALSGALTIGDAIDAGTGSINLTADAGSISGMAQVKGNHLNAMALNGIDLSTAVAGLSADNAGSGSDITIRNTGPLSLFSVRQSGTESTGNITIENTGALTVGAESQIAARRGAINLTAFSPLTIEEYASVKTDATTPGEGNITLWAHGSAVPTGTDILTINGSVSTLAGNITLKAGDSIIGASNAVSSGGGTVTTLAQMNAMSPPSSPPSSISTQGQASNAILTTIALINQAQPPVVSDSSFATPPEGGGEQVPDSEDRVSEEKNVASEKTAGVKENETAKKLYCN